MLIHTVRIRIELHQWSDPAFLCPCKSLRESQRMILRPLRGMQVGQAAKELPQYHMIKNINGFSRLKSRMDSLSCSPMICLICSVISSLLFYIRECNLLVIGAEIYRGGALSIPESKGNFEHFQPCQLNFSYWPQQYCFWCSEDLQWRWHFV